MAILTVYTELLDNTLDGARIIRYGYSTIMCLFRVTKRQGG